MSNDIYTCDDCVIERIETEEPEDCICEEPEEESVVMTSEEVSAFDCYVWNELYMKSCVNYCEECDIEYYRHCSCECREECEEEGYEFTPEDEEYCWEYDYQLFIEDNYDMIMDIYEELLEEKQERIIAKEKESNVIVVYEF
jgi:hypothetical protein